MAVAAPIRILLADHHAIVRSGLRAILQNMPGFKVVADAANGREALALVKTHQPDIAFLAISMSNLNGLEALQHIVKNFPRTRVIIFTGHATEGYYWRALQLGAAGYILKTATEAEVKAGIQCVAGGEIYLSREIHRRLRKELPLQRLAKDNSPLAQLSARQREILQLTAEGQTTKSIALIISRSDKCVEYHRANLMRRLNIYDTAGLTRFAIRSGLIQP